MSLKALSWNKEDGDFNCSFQLKSPSITITTKKGRNNPSSNKALFAYDVIFIQHVLEHLFASQQVSFKMALISPFTIDRYTQWLYCG